MHRRRDDILAYFDHRASNGPTKAINRRLEALRRNTLDFRNLINYRIRHCALQSSRTLNPEEPDNRELFDVSHPLGRMSSGANDLFTSSIRTYKSPSTIVHTVS